MRLLVTRAEADAQKTAQQLSALGHDVLLASLLRIDIPQGPALRLDGMQGVIVTSANGARALAMRLTRRDLPLYAVGKHTAKIACGLGFTQINYSSGNGADLADMIQQWTTPEAGPLFHAHANRSNARLGEKLRQTGFTLHSEVLYQVRGISALPPSVISALQQTELDGVLIYSPLAGETFAACIMKAGLTEHCRSLLAIFISDAAAKACAALTFGEVRIAALPDEPHMLALLP